MFFEKLFNESGRLMIDYDDKKVYRCLKIMKPGRYTIIVKSVTSHSEYNQALIFHIGNVDGKVMVNNRSYQKRGVFSQLILPEEDLSEETTIEIELNSGSFVICNGSDPLGTKQIWRSLTMGSALTGITLEHGWCRVNCNDFEYDDDFDDFVFEMMVERDCEPIDVFNECELLI